MKNENLYNYILGIADNSLILGQRLGELTGHGPNLETDIACTNISLDCYLDLCKIKNLEKRNTLDG